jgi:hypothetical protein
MEMTFKVTAGRLIRRGAAAIAPTTKTGMSQMSVRLDERMMLNTAAHLPPPRREVDGKKDIQILLNRRAENKGGG